VLQVLKSSARSINARDAVAITALAACGNHRLGRRDDVSLGSGGVWVLALWEHVTDRFVRHFGGVMLTIEARAVGRRRELVPRWWLPFPQGWAAADGLTLREVIALVVREEVTAFEQRQAERRFLRVLTERQINEGSAAGRVVSGGEGRQQHVDVNTVIDTAWSAFEDGLYLVLIDAVQCGRLDEPVRLGQDSTIMFVRLVALAGG
jgi:hypothetical protein